MLFGWSSLYLLGSFHWFNVPVNFFGFFTTEFVARNNASLSSYHEKATVAQSFKRIRTCLRVDIFQVFRLTFDFLPRKVGACLKTPCRDDHHKASYPRTQQRDQGAGKTQIAQSRSLWKRRRHLYPFRNAANLNTNKKEKTIKRKRYFRSLFNYFILSLSISDLIAAILSPCTLYRTGWGFEYWTAPAFLCKVKCVSYSVFTDDVVVCLRIIDGEVL